MRAGEFTCPGSRFPHFPNTNDCPGETEQDGPIWGGHYIAVWSNRGLLVPSDGHARIPSCAPPPPPPPPSPGPLFVFQDGATLSRARLVQSLHEALVLVGMDDGRFSNHSFRIGAAKAAASAGLQDSLIKTLGRWRSQSTGEEEAISLWSDP